MIAELLGHLMLTSSLLRVIPADAAVFELQAGVTEETVRLHAPADAGFATGNIYGSSGGQGQP